MYNTCSTFTIKEIQKLCASLFVAYSLMGCQDLFLKNNPRYPYTEMVLINQTSYRLKISVFEKGKLYESVEIPKGGQVSKLIGDGGQSYFTNTFIDSAVIESGSKILVQYCNGEILIYGNVTPSCKGLPNNLLINPTKNTRVDEKKEGVYVDRRFEWTFKESDFE